MSKESYKDIFKILVIGAKGVGKTALIEQFSDESLHKDIAPKVGVNFFIKIISVDGEQYKFQFWDIIDNEKFGSLQNMYYTGASAIFFVFDLSKPNTFDYSCTRYKKLLEQAKADACPIILIGNKQDLVKDHETIDRTKYRQFVKKEGLLGYIELRSINSVEKLLKFMPKFIQEAMKKNHQVKFLVNSKELEEIKSYARLIHQTQSEFIRTAIWEKIGSLDPSSSSKSMISKKSRDKSNLRLAELRKIRELLEKLE